MPRSLDNRFSPRARREPFYVSFTTSHLPVENQSKHLSIKKKKRKINSTCSKEGIGIQLDSVVWKLPLFLFRNGIYIYFCRVSTRVSSFAFCKRFCIQLLKSLSMELAVRYIWVCASLDHFSPFLVYNWYNKFDKFSLRRDFESWESETRNYFAVKWV